MPRPRRRPIPWRPTVEMLDPLRLWKRVSQITGVPITEMKPSQGVNNQVNPSYDAVTHRIDTKSIRMKSIQDHEERHGIQRIVENSPELTALARKAKHKKLDRIPPAIVKAHVERTTTHELTNPAHTIPWNELIDQRRMPLNYLFPAALGLAITGHIPYYIAALIAPYQRLFRTIQFRSIVRKHGADAALLLWAHPPINTKGKVTLSFGEWEKRMVGEGYLHPTGGFTRKGIRLFRTYANAPEIRRKLTLIEQMREA